MMRVFVADDLFRRFPKRAIEKSTIISLAAKHAPELVENIRQEITIELADLVLAEQLDCPVGSPVVKIRRYGYAADRRLAYSTVTWYRAESFKMEMTLVARRLARKQAPR